MPAPVHRAISRAKLRHLQAFELYTAGVPWVRFGFHRSNGGAIWRSYKHIIGIHPQSDREVWHATFDLSPIERDYTGVN